MANIQNSDIYFDYILREKKSAMRLSDYKETGIWNEDSVYDDVYLTEDEVIMFEDIYRSKFFPKKPIDISSLRTNFVNGESYEAEYNAILDFVFKYYKQVEDWYDIIIDVNSNQMTFNSGTFDNETVEITNSDDIYFIQNYLKTLVEKYGNGNDMRIYPKGIAFGYNGMLYDNVFYDSLPA